ncbi:MAG: hypothetical protein Q8Q35_01380 [Nanoarchaeota archaeon]|nr:hypothetical protein [Nanoarchaeota archaeon]
MDLEKVEERLEDEEEGSKWKKYFVMAGALFLILLMLSYSIASFPIGEIIISLVNSEEIVDNKIVDDVVVNFEGETYQEVLNMYNENLAQEFKVCLLGDYDGEYNIKEVFFPKMHSQFFNKVVSEPCPNETLVSLHSHPYRHCIASEQDMSNLAGLKESNKNALIGIMCEEGRFNFYDEV